MYVSASEWVSSPSTLGGGINGAALVIVEELEERGEKNLDGRESGGGGTGGDIGGASSDMGDVNILSCPSSSIILLFSSSLVDSRSEERKAGVGGSMLSLLKCTG